MGEQKTVQITLKFNMFILSPSQGAFVKPPSWVLPSDPHSHPISTNTLAMGYLRERTVFYLVKILINHSGYGRLALRVGGSELLGLGRYKERVAGLEAIL